MDPTSGEDELRNTHTSHEKGLHSFHQMYVIVSKHF